MAVLTIDPGGTVGVAHWRDSVLLRAWSVPFAKFMDREIPAVSLAVIEIPDHFAVRTQDVLKCAFRAGQISGRFARFETMLVGRWKGSVPKRITERRVKAALTKEEMERISKFDSHVVDALGMGLVYFGRMSR